MWPAIAAGISAVSNLVAGNRADKATRHANEIAMSQADRNVALQKEFAQSGIQWKVEDAKKAGIHPLYALGASTTSFAPVSVGITPETGSARGIAAMGQDISRAVHATRSGGDRVGAIAETAQRLQLENMGLQNQLLASQIARLNQQTNPSMPVGDNYLVDGQGQTVVAPKDKVLDRVVSAPGQPESEHAAIADVGYARTKYGHYPVPSKDVKERIEDNIFQEVMHFIRNNLLPMVGANMSPPPVELKEGERWVYHPIYGYRGKSRLPYQLY